jgi:hypothetical protein
MDSVERVDTIHPMKRGAAFVSYYVGLVFGLGTMFTVARNADAWEFLLVPIYGLPIWWIAAGIGIRLSVYPSEFFRRLATAAGLVEPQEAKREASTQG